MNSMTGHGRGEGVQPGGKVTVEISAVNRRQSETALTLPHELEPLETQVREVINRRVARGRLTVTVTLTTADDRFGSRVRVNTPLARAYAREAAGLARDLKLASGLSVDTLLRLPGVVQADVEVAGAEALWPAVETALDRALTALGKMRGREGAHLGRDLRARVQALRKLTAQVERRAPRVSTHYREQLLERIHRAGLETVVSDDERLLKEVLLFADRSDITEELTRLQSHFQQFNTLAASDEAVGRTLDFLAQEMNREVNTIGSKANDSEISRAVVALKAELEKFREQVQNVE